MCHSLFGFIWILKSKAVICSDVTYCNLVLGWIRSMMLSKIKNCPDITSDKDDFNHLCIWTIALSAFSTLLYITVDTLAVHCHNWMQNKANKNILDISLKEDKVSFIDSSQQENITFQPLWHILWFKIKCKRRNMYNRSAVMEIT